MGVLSTWYYNNKFIEFFGWSFWGNDNVWKNSLTSTSFNVSFKGQYTPYFSSCLLFELYQTNVGHHVEIYYKQQNTEFLNALEPLFIPNCGKKCPLARFYELYEDILPTNDFDVECQNNRV